MKWVRPVRGTSIREENGKILHPCCIWYVLGQFFIAGGTTGPAVGAKPCSYPVQKSATLYKPKLREQQSFPNHMHKMPSKLIRTAQTVSLPHFPLPSLSPAEPDHLEKDLPQVRKCDALLAKPSGGSGTRAVRCAGMSDDQPSSPPQRPEQALRIVC